MRLPRASGMLRLVALTLIASPFAMAQDSGLYIGGNFGKSKATIDDARIASSLVGFGATGISISDRNDDKGFKLFLGYQFNKYFSLEGGYFDLGKFGFTATTVPAGTLVGDIKLNGFNIDAVLNLPITEKFSFFGRVGANNAEAKDSFSGTGMVSVLNPNPTQRGTNIKFGGGLQFDFTKSVGMRLEAERYRIDDAVGNKGDIDLYSVGLLIRFGRNAPASAPPPPVAAPEPPPPPAPEPPPPAPPIEEVPQAAVVVVPVLGQTEKYCTILDLTFEIDRDKIQKDDLEKLKVIGVFLTKYPSSTAVIEGHTDNVGTPEHNMQLSQERAESVVTYLVDEVHIDRSRLRAVGYGFSRPIGDNSTEEGKRQNRRIDAVVACVMDFEGLVVAPARMTMALDMEFDAQGADIRPEYHESLRKVAVFLKANPSVNASVEGHTGNLQATEALRMEISQRRAQNVVDYLVTSEGIDRSRLTATGFGRSRRVAYNTSLEGQQENRRINIIITYPRSR